MNVTIRLQSSSKSRTAEVSDLPITIGSAARNPVHLPGRGFEPQHVRISLSADGLVAEDLNTASGTICDGERISRRVMRHRDRLICGDVRIEFFFPTSGIMTLAGGDLVLELLDPPLTGTLAQLPDSAEAPLTVGRFDNCDLMIPQRRVSGQHAVIMRRVNGTLVVIDKGSRNGTYVNGKAVAVGEPAELFPGAIVEFGAFGAYVRQSNPQTDPQITVAPGMATGAGRDPQPSESSMTMADVPMAESVVGPIRIPSSGRLPAMPKLTSVPMAAMFGAVAPTADGPAAAAAVRPASGLRDASSADGSGASAHPNAAGHAGGEWGPQAPPADWAIAARYAHLAGPALSAVTGPALVALPAPNAIQPPSEQPRMLPLAGSMVVGRKRDAHLRLLNPEISGLHAMFEPIPGRPSEFLVRDTGSQNGTFVNGCAVSAHPLRHLDRITLGPFHYLYVAAGNSFPPHNRREWPRDVRTRVDAMMHGERIVRRPIVAFLFELGSVLVAVSLVTVLILAHHGALPPLDECLELLARAFARQFAG